MYSWYPQDKKELIKFLDKYLNSKQNILVNEIHGLIVPHAGYEFSGEITGKAYSLLKNLKQKKAIILSPSHYIPLTEIKTYNQSSWNTPLENIPITKNNYQKLDIHMEHAIDNQIPFLQRLNFKEILPLIIGEINEKQAIKTAEELAKMKDVIFIISTDLSHFNSYEKAKQIDKNTIELIKTLNNKNQNQLDACGKYPLMILIELCKIKKWSPKLIEYKNSGDITGEKSSVVGYASFYF